MTSGQCESPPASPSFPEHRKSQSDGGARRPALPPPDRLRRHAASVVRVAQSHNPAADNGYKIYWENACQIIPPHDSGISKSIAENLSPWCRYDLLPLETATESVRDITDDISASDRGSAITFDTQAGHFYRAQVGGCTRWDGAQYRQPVSRDYLDVADRLLSENRRAVSWPTCSCASWHVRAA